MAKATLAINPVLLKLCAANECQNTVKGGRRYCSKHATRLRNHGSLSTNIRPGQRRMPRAQRFWAKVAITADDSRCWEWQAHRSPQGYGKFRGEQSTLATHYAWFLAYGRWTDKLLRHTCDNPPCVNVRHLIEGSHMDNMLDMKIRKRSTTGMRSGKAKLTDQDVREIRRLREIGIGQRKVARRFGVSHTNIGAIERRETWTEV